MVFLHDAKTAIGYAAVHIGGGQFIYASSSAGKVVTFPLPITTLTITGRGA